MAFQFERITSTGNVLYKDGTKLLRVFEPNAFVTADPRDADVIRIDSDPGAAQENQMFEFKASSVDFPVHTGRDDLIRQLATDFFKGPSISVTASQGPIQFVKDSIDTEVQIDTTTPANNELLPVNIYDNTGLKGINYNPFIVNFPNELLDAGGRQRVSSLTAEGEYKNIQDKIDDLKDEAGTGISAHVVNDNGVTGTKLSVAPGQWLVRESKYSHFYNSGESHFIEFTTQNLAIEAGVIKRIGYFSSNTTAPFNASFDGIWIESNGVENDYFLCSFLEGSQVLRLARSNWYDPLDGTGPSGLTLDFTAFNIYQFDFLWLGGSAIRYSTYIGSKLINLHTYIHSGVEQGVIFRSPHQPIRYEIRSTTGAGFVYDICSQVSTEGSQNTIGIPRAIDLSFNTINANIIGNFYLLVAARINPNRRNNIVNISGFGGFATTNDAFRIVILKNPTIANIPAWVDYSPTSAIQYIRGDFANNPSNTLITGGELLKSFGVSQRAGESTIDIRDVLFKLSRNLDGTSEIYAVCVAPLSPNLDISGQMELIEKI